MTLRLVTQQNQSGCFVASVAMLLNKSYAEAFALLRPGSEMIQSHCHGFRELSMEEMVHKQLQKLGFKSRTSKYRQFRSYQNHIQKNAILIIRWVSVPILCHCIVFDAEVKKFIDPNGGCYIEHNTVIRGLQKQLDCGIIIEHIPDIEVSHDFHRSPYSNSRAWRENFVRQNLLHSNG